MATHVASQDAALPVPGSSMQSVHRNATYGANWGQIAEQDLNTDSTRSLAMFGTEELVETLP